MLLWWENVLESNDMNSRRNLMKQMDCSGNEKKSIANYCVTSEIPELAIR
jgi:hypothetical protein